jgi:hypothetical protein
MVDGGIVGWKITTDGETMRYVDAGVTGPVFDKISPRTFTCDGMIP